MRKIVKEIFSSDLLRREIPYRILLPENYRLFEKKYPVLYLLHGLFGCCDNWLELTGLSEYSADQELIIVLPEGQDGWYTDSATIAEDKFESHFLEELIPQIDGLYKTLDRKEKRAVAGLSMGGYGALKFGIKRPDLFAFAGSMSGAFEAPRQSDQHPGFDWENLRPSVTKVYGEENSQTRENNDLFRIVRQINDRNIDQLPQFYIDCGRQDGFLAANRKLVRLLKRRKIPFVYREEEGGHDWIYWDQRIRSLLPIVAEKLIGL